MTDTVEIFVPLLEEGTPTIRGTQAIPLGDDLYQVLPTPHYDPEDEIWEFLPGSVVKCDVKKSFFTKKDILRAYAVRNSDGTFTRSVDAPEK